MLRVDCFVSRDDTEIDSFLVLRPNVDGVAKVDV